MSASKARDVHPRIRIHPDFWTQLEPTPIPVIDLSKPLIRVCMKCSRQLDGTSNRPIGNPIPLTPGQSSGVCVECVREWGEDMGLSESDINALETAAKQAA